jgi:hypothetical protein
MGNRAEKYSQIMLKIFARANQRYQENYENIGKCNNEQQDILHEIELANNPDEQHARNLFLALRDSRKFRRQLMNENELLQPLVDLLRENEKFRQKLCRVHAKISHIERLQDDRRYKARIRDDLSICQGDDEEIL